MKNKGCKKCGSKSFYIKQCVTYQLDDDMNLVYDDLREIKMESRIICNDCQEGHLPEYFNKIISGVDIIDETASDFLTFVGDIKKTLDECMTNCNIKFHEPENCTIEIDDQGNITKIN